MHDRTENHGYNRVSAHGNKSAKLHIGLNYYFE